MCCNCHKHYDSGYISVHNKKICVSDKTNNKKYKNLNNKEININDKNIRHFEYHYENIFDKFEIISNTSKS